MSRRHTGLLLKCTLRDREPAAGRRQLLCAHSATCCQPRNLQKEKTPHAWVSTITPRVINICVLPLIRKGLHTDPFVVMSCSEHLYCPVMLVECRTRVTVSILASRPHVTAHKLLKQRDKCVFPHC